MNAERVAAIHEKAGTEEMLTVTEVAVILRRSANSILNNLVAGKLPELRARKMFGKGKWLIPVSAVKAEMERAERLSLGKGGQR